MATGIRLPLMGYVAGDRRVLDADLLDCGWLRFGMQEWIYPGRGRLQWAADEERLAGIDGTGMWFCSGIGAPAGLERFARARRFTITHTLDDLRELPVSGVSAQQAGTVRMTTIAVDGKLVAAEGRRTAGSEIVADDVRKIVVKHGRIYVLAGEIAARDAIIEWHDKGADPGKQPGASKDGSWILVVIDRDRVMRSFHNDLPYPQQNPMPQAFGSGASFALGAMRAGADARRAVEIACGLDVYSGGGIQVVDIDEALGLCTLKAAAE